MKRTVVCIALFLGAVALAPRAHAGMAYGIKAGVGLSHVNADLFDTQNRVGLAAGLYGAFDLSPFLAVQPELLYVRKGAKLFETNVTIGGITFGRVGTTLDVDYLEIPVLLRLSLMPAGPLDLRLLAGPVASFKMNEQLTTTGLIGYSLGTNQVKSADYSLAAGGAVVVRGGGLTLVGEGRYTYGLVNVSDLPFGGNVKNAAFYGLAGLEFPLGK